ncbi:SDR family oxidoreductase [Egibacter rhizosphaerae]|uniref:SDR family oxidoreductase n=1 Tax=Egibacter rhizosphaerae TaxID=1670831 RepID=A0A411YKB0_9ACTN|nr:SDR family oxidoreductase [Egibacter rhizosphaerae]QBI21621.1 SDR family oxidoreductase [Egibacter rhizosphaerae]
MARVLVLGATGYVGGRLVPRLLAVGHDVRVVARRPAKLTGVSWAADVALHEGDLLRPETLRGAFDDIDVVYYLVHSMGGAAAFAETDRRIAGTVAACASAAGVRRIVYLGGLGEIDDRTSTHLRSRAEVGELLVASEVPTTVLRAAVIIGSGSASFEMLRHLTEKLPVMVAPKWVHTRCQPIAIRDVLGYLVAALDDSSDEDRVHDIGGPDVLTYAEMLQGYARVAGLPRRLILTVPVLTPKLSSYWIGLVSPVPTGVARPLVESLSQEVVVRDDPATDSTRWVPDPPVSYEQALRHVLRRVRDREVETSWREAELPWRESELPTGPGRRRDALAAGDASPAEPQPEDPVWAGGTLLSDVQEAVAAAASPEVFSTVARIGGDRGWPVHQWAWSLRGFADQLIGGVGLRRGRRDPDRLRVGDAVDFWRVEEMRAPVAPGDVGLLRLRAEMWVPGHAWLEFRLLPEHGGGTRLRQRALFAPRSLLGRLYWYAMLPFHALIFRRMAQALADEAGLTSSGGPTAARGVRAAAGRIRRVRRPPARRAG